MGNVCWQMQLFCHQQAVGFISLADCETVSAAAQLNNAARQVSDLQHV